MPPGSFISSTLSSVDSNLFSYFVLSICPSCSLSPSQNPYLFYLTPMSFEYPVLRSALLAASANQLRLLGDRRFERDAWSHKAKAIRGVQEAIDSGVVDVGVVATILMLCFYDVCAHNDVMGDAPARRNGSSRPRFRSRIFSDTRSEPPVVPANVFCSSRHHEPHGLR